MKIINLERQKFAGSTVDSSDSNFPLANLFDNHPRNWWKADNINVATLRVKIAGGSNAIALFSTNTDTAVCTITQDADEQTLNPAAAVDKGAGLVGIPVTGHGYAPGIQVLFNGTGNFDGVHTIDASTSTDEIVIEAAYAAETFSGSETVAEVKASKSFDLRVIDSYEKLILDDPEIYRQFWMGYTYQSVSCTATIKLAAVAGATVRAGVVKAGAALSISNPASGLQEGRKDYSISKELNNGAFYSRKRNIVRTFSGSVTVDRDTDFYRLMDVADQFGPDPFACLVADNIDDQEWAVYAKFNGGLPGGTHGYPTKSAVNFTLLEVV